LNQTPFLGKRQAIATGDPNLVERPRHCSKAGGGDAGFQRVLDTVDLDSISGAKIDARSEASTVAQKQPSERLELSARGAAVEIWTNQRASNAGTIVGRL